METFKVVVAGDAAVCFWDGMSRGTKSMIELARRKRLAVRVIPY